MVSWGLWSRTQKPFRSQSPWVLRTRFYGSSRVTPNSDGWVGKGSKKKDAWLTSPAWTLGMYVTKLLCGSGHSHWHTGTASQNGPCEGTQPTGPQVVVATTGHQSSAQNLRCASLCRLLWRWAWDLSFTACSHDRLIKDVDWRTYLHSWGFLQVGKKRPTSGFNPRLCVVPSHQRCQDPRNNRGRLLLCLPVYNCWFSSTQWLFMGEGR